MKKPLIYILVSVAILTSCGNKAELDKNEVLASEVLDQIEEEVTLPIMKGLVVDPMRNRLLYDTYYNLDKIIEISEYSIKSNRVDSFYQALQLCDKKISNKYARDIGLTEKYRTLVVDKLEGCSDECVQILLRAYLISIGPKLIELVDDKSISIDSLSFATKRLKDDSILIYPVLHNETRFCRLVVDGDTMGRPYDRIGLTKQEFERATYITVGIKNREGKIMEIKIK